jgi:hypothetical protein
MGKLHEVLAVEGDLKAKAQRELRRVSGVFGSEQLIGMVRSYTPLDEEGMPLPGEYQELATTVRDELVAVAQHMGAWMDAAYQKEQGNTVTATDIIVDGVLLIKDISSPALLNLESKLVEVRKTYEAMPVLNPGERWHYDDGDGCWKAEPRITFRTQKVRKSFVAYEATDKHPAQVEVFTEDDRVGTWETVMYAGAVTAVEKQEYLDRIDKLIRAVKIARQRANDIEVTKEGISSTVFKYINGD